MAGLTPKLPLARDAINGYTLITEYKTLVRQNFKNLIFTIPGERVMDRDFGIGLKRYLFELDKPGLYGQISARINSQVSRYLPYIKITDIIFDSAETNEELDPHFLNVRIEYEILPLQTTDKIELNLPS